MPLLFRRSYRGPDGNTSASVTAYPHGMRRFVWLILFCFYLSSCFSRTVERPGWWSASVIQDVSVAIINKSHRLRVCLVSDSAKDFRDVEGESSVDAWGYGAILVTMIVIFYSDYLPRVEPNGF